MRDVCPQDKKKEVKTQAQGAYAIFGALCVAYIIIKIYISMKNGRSYQWVMPYSNLYCNNRYSR